MDENDEKQIEAVDTDQRIDSRSSLPFSCNRPWVWAVGSVVLSGVAIGLSLALTHTWTDPTISVAGRILRACGLSVLAGAVGFSVAITISHYFARLMGGAGGVSATAASIANPALVLLAIPNSRLAGIAGMFYVIVATALVMKAHRIGPGRAVSSVVGGLSMMVVFILIIAGGVISPTVQ